MNKIDWKIIIWSLQFGTCFTSILSCAGFFYFGLVVEPLSYKLMAFLFSFLSAVSGGISAIALHYFIDED